MFSFLILSNLLNIGKNCCELRSEKREVLLVSFSDFAHFVFAIIDGLNRFDMGMGIGLGLEFDRFLVGLDTRYGFLHIADNTKAYNIALFFNVGYKF